jgi:hypothetical protein
VDDHPEQPPHHAGANPAHVKGQPHQRGIRLFFQDPTGCLYPPPPSRTISRSPPPQGAVLTRRPLPDGSSASVSAVEHPHPTSGGGGLLTHLRGQVLLRKEVIQPHLPVRLPCYDFVPIASPTFDGSLPQGVGPPASGVADFRDVTGGVYKARERIHRSVADLRLLATPTSWGRVADPNPN